MDVVGETSQKLTIPTPKLFLAQVSDDTKPLVEETLRTCHIDNETLTQTLVNWKKAGPKVQELDRTR
jgi:hypothetical protein